ncbi:MAG: signal peptidase II [Oscillospiraceae bacterium]|nr:signal peptidase II [Oscillospiraceae bacterium]
MLYAIVAVVALILDQMLKYWATVNIAENSVGYMEVRELLPGLVRLTNFHNTGAAFSFLANASWARWFFVVLCLLFVAAVVYALARGTINTPVARWAAVMVAAGAIGNCIDRVINGYVVDMIEFDFTIFGHRFPVFNLADMYITLGAIVFIICLFVEKPAEPANAGRAGAAPAGGDHVSSPGIPPIATFLMDADADEEDVTEANLFGPAQPAAKRAQRRAPQPLPQPAQPPKAPPDPPQQIQAPPAPAAPERVPAPVQPEPQPSVEPQPEPEPVPQPEPEPVPQPQPAEKPAPEPQPAPAAEESYSLDDILAEFRDI